MADDKKPVPVLARVTRTSYLNDTLIEVEHGAEGPIVRWPVGVDVETAGDNLIPLNEDATPFVIGGTKKSKAVDPAPPVPPAA